jgi:sigma-B regulation protein RsbU (phosphoserine phosphatase)
MGKEASEPAASVAEHRMQCMELWGGFSETQKSVTMTGLKGYVYSRPWNDERHGGDVYYFSSCASGRISRILLADVTGHGDAVAGTASMLRQVMRRNVNTIRQTRLINAINREFVDIARSGGFATSLVATYFSPRQSLSLSIAGHPPPLLFQKATGQWSVFGEREQQQGQLAGLPLGISSDVMYGALTVDFVPGDQLLCYTDAFYEALDAEGEMLQTDGLLNLMRQAPQLPSEALIPWLIERVSSMRAQNLQDDDTTAIAVEAIPDKITMRANLMAPLRLLRGVKDRTNT